MKVVFLHPPMYPVCVDLFNIMGKFMDLTVCQIGEYPSHHTSWTVENLGKYIQNFKLKVYGKGPYSLSNLINPIFIRDLCRDKPDLIVSIGFWIPGIYAGIYAKLAKKPLLIQANIPDYRISTGNICRYYYRRFSAGLASAFVATTEDSKVFLKKISGRKPVYKSIQTIDIVKWKKEIDLLPSKVDLRRKWKLPIHKTVLLGVGLIIHLKNWESVLYNLKRLNGNTIFLLTGKGENTDKLHEIARELKIESRFILSGYKTQEEIKELYKISDILVFPSHCDTFGFAVLEGLASGLPVICSRKAGAHSLVRDSFNGFLIDPDEDYSGKINKIIDDMENMAENAGKSVASYTLENSARELHGIFRKTLTL